MKLKEIIDFIDEKIPKKLALSFDNVGFMGEYDLNSNITSIKDIQIDLDIDVKEKELLNPVNWK